MTKSASWEFHIGGMTCINCQNRIEQRLKRTDGVRQIHVRYRTGTAKIVYEPEKISPNRIKRILSGLGYTILPESTPEKPRRRLQAATLLLILLLFLLLQWFGVLNRLVPSQLADSSMSLGMLFVVGLLTSVHCVAMCGGINLSQCIPREPEDVSRLRTFLPALLYNAGRVLSYTAIGFLLGGAGLLLGGAGSGLPTAAQGALKLVAGAVMVVTGLNLLGLFPALRKLQPHLPSALSRKLSQETQRQSRPFVVGLLNGLMPCGPLQSMQLVALASGSPLTGALSMLLFSLGTVPLMLGLGEIVSALGRKFTAKVMWLGAVLVVVLGLAMLSQGGGLAGLRTPFSSVIPAVSADSSAGAEQADSGVQEIHSTLSTGGYPDITVQAGIPVRWVIDVPEGVLNGCNYKMQIPAYEIEYTFQEGENVIEFTPEKNGSIPYSCWMGMIQATIYVE